MVAKAISGDVSAAKFIADRLCGALPKAELSIDARSVNVNGQAGPPIPEPRELAEHIKRLAELSAEYLDDEEGED